MGWLSWRTIMRLKRYSKPSFLQTIGRELLEQFFGRFAADLAAMDVMLPSESASDDEFFDQVAKLLLAPDGLPETMSDVLYALEEMSSPEGVEVLEQAAIEARLPLACYNDASAVDVVMQVWLTAPGLLAEKHNQQKIRRLTKFEHFPSNVAPEDRVAFTPLSSERLGQLTAELDAWFAKHHRGAGNSRIEVHQFEKKWWFVVRHGDRVHRTPVVDSGRTEVLHFRPEMDDVVGFDEELDELSIHASTKGEKELYRQTFGRFLRASDLHFQQRKTYTLEPLRELQEDALDVSDVPGITMIVLREIEMAWPSRFNSTQTRVSDDIFAEARSRGADPIPVSGRLLRAGFDVYFDRAVKPRKVQVRAGNVLKVGRRCDRELIMQWLTRRGFRLGAAGNGTNGTNATDMKGGCDVVVACD
jgi:hypothetical protein